MMNCLIAFVTTPDLRIEKQHRQEGLPCYPTGHCSWTGLVQCPAKRRWLLTGRIMSWPHNPVEGPSNRTGQKTEKCVIGPELLLAKLACCTRFLLLGGLVSQSDKPDFVGEIILSGRASTCRFLVHGGFVHRTTGNGGSLF